jgi:hypothetical protein
MRTAQVYVDRDEPMISGFVIAFSPVVSAGKYRQTLASPISRHHVRCRRS